MAKNVFADLGGSDTPPMNRILSQEFVAGLNKAGSLFSMLENKKINSTTLFSLLLETPLYQDFFVEITSSEDIRDAILSVLYLYPSIIKSKVTKTVVRKINAIQNNRARKTTLQ